MTTEVTTGLDHAQHHIRVVNAFRCYMCDFFVVGQMLPKALLEFVHGLPQEKFSFFLTCQKSMKIASQKGDWLDSESFNDFMPFDCSCWHQMSERCSCFSAVPTNPPGSMMSNSIAFHPGGLNPELLPFGLLPLARHHQQLATFRMCSKARSRTAYQWLQVEEKHHVTFRIAPC